MAQICSGMIVAGSPEPGASASRPLRSCRRRALSGGHVEAAHDPHRRRDRLGNSGQTVRLYYKPLVSWIWAGASLMVLGGALSLSDRRLRIGAPLRRLKPAAALG